MSKFRKRPLVVEAERFVLDSRAFPRGVKYVEGDDMLGTGYYVVTIHGQRTSVVPGDWIITEPDGEHFYPCKSDIFEATYEEVACTDTRSSLEIRNEILARFPNVSPARQRTLARLVSEYAERVAAAKVAEATKEATEAAQKQAMAADLLVLSGTTAFLMLHRNQPKMAVSLLWNEGWRRVSARQHPEGP